MPVPNPAAKTSAQSRALNFMAISYPYFDLIRKLVTAPRTTPAVHAVAAQAPKAGPPRSVPIAQVVAPQPQNEPADEAAAFQPTIVAPLPPVFGLHGKSGSR